jgi:hypothetical protein
VPYKECVISFLDVIGFGDLVRRKTAEQMEEILRTFFESASFDDTVARFGGDIVNFSDTVVRFEPVGPNRHGVLVCELNTLMHIQADAIWQGILIRGAITIGKLRYVVDANRRTSHLFGPGLVKAHRLESQLAYYPRIIVDDTVISGHRHDPRLRSDIHTQREDFAYLKEVVRRDADGVPFIDYLRAMSTECDSPDQYLRLLQKHREVAREAAKGTRRHIDLRSLKGSWLVWYHNEVVNWLSEGWLREVGARRRDLLVGHTRLR